MGCIYTITHCESGKSYVGKTVQPLSVRWGGHIGGARRGDNGMLVCRAIKKHGVVACERRAIEECSDDALGVREMYWINQLKTHVTQGGYNLTLGGDGGLSGYVFSDASREKIRQRAIGRKHTPETRAKMCESAKRRIVTSQTIEKRAAANRGKKRTPEQRVRLAQGQLMRYARKRAALENQ